MICFKVFTLFPDVIQSYVNHNAPLKRGIENKVLKIDCVNFRDYSKNRHKKVDDEVYGGGPGMLITPAPLIDAVKDHKTSKTRIFIMDPRGKVLNNELAKEISKESEVFLICGRYEGFDQRAIDILDAQMISLGDFVMTGGEIAAMAVIDSASRFVEGSLDDFRSQEDESFNHGFLENDQYTRPPVFEGKSVPEELNSGHHKKIIEWKMASSLKNTLIFRPDLLKSIKMDSHKVKILKNIIQEKYLEKK